MSFESRFLKRAAANPNFEAEVRTKFGFDSRGVGQLLDMASRLSSPAGAQLTHRDVDTLQQLHPSVPKHQISAMADHINHLSPDRRFEAFAGSLAEDPAAMYGDRVNAGERFKAIEEMTRDYTQADYAEALIQRRGGVAVEPRFKPEPTSTRALLESQFENKTLRRAVDDMNAGNPYAENLVRHTVANDMESAIERLQEPEASARDTVAAAFDYHAGADIAETEFGVTQGDN